MDTRVWIDDPNPIFRMGLACCLRRPGFVLIGESSGFVPQPDLDRTDILVFDLGEQTLGWALGRAGERRPARLLGLVGGGGPDREMAHGLCTVLVRSELTPTAFVDCLRSLADLRPPALEPRPLAAPGLSEEELEVLRLLAQGEGPRSPGDSGSPAGPLGTWWPGSSSAWGPAARPRPWPGRCRKG